MKHFFFILSSIISFLILLLYLIAILSNNGPFDIFSFFKSFAISFPFLLLIAYIDYQLVLFVNNSSYFTIHPWLRIIFEITILIIIAILFVVIGNMPFYDQIQMYIESKGYRQSVIAAILINVFTIIILEYIVQLKKNQILIQENLDIRYKELKNQINPHFLFNSLNMLVSLINKDPQLAIKYTKKLSEVYRYVLSSDVDNIIFIDEEIRFIINYIEILKMRYGKGLEITITINETDKKRLIVPMALQVLIENAVKHNSVSPSNPLKIRISSDNNNLIISNNLNPRVSVESGTGIGIANLDKKYQIISDKHIHLTKDEYAFTVKLPLL